MQPYQKSRGWFSVKENKIRTKDLTVTALLMALNIIMSTSVLSVPVPGGHMYLNDVIIVTAAILLEPFFAFLVGGSAPSSATCSFTPRPCSSRSSCTGRRP